MNPWLQDANRDGKTLKERTLKRFQVINYLDGFISAKTPSDSGSLNILAPIQTNLSSMKQDRLKNISQSLEAKKCFRKNLATVKVMMVNCYRNENVPKPKAKSLSLETGKQWVQWQKGGLMNEKS